MANNSLIPIERGMSNGAEAINSNFNTMQDQIKNSDIQAGVGALETNWSGKASIQKVGRVVTISADVVCANNTGNLEAFVLPAWALPAMPLQTSGFEMNGDYHNRTAVAVRVNATGAVTLEPTNAYALIGFTLTYISAS